MFSGWVQYLQLTAKAKTGISLSVVVFGVVAVLATVVTIVFLILAGYVWLANRYGALLAALVMCAAFLFLAIAAAIASLLARRRNVNRAQIALAARGHSSLLDPKMLGVGLQIGRSIGLRKVVPLVAVGVLAATFAKEWFGSERRQAVAEERRRGDVN